MYSSYAVVLCEVWCDWRQEPPRYRMYVNSELFVERRYIWRSAFLDEMIPIWTNSGDYKIHYELVPGSAGTLEIKNMRIADAPPGATILDNSVLRIP